MLHFCETETVKGRQHDSCMAQPFSSIFMLNVSAPVTANPVVIEHSTSLTNVKGMDTPSSLYLSRLVYIISIHMEHLSLNHLPVNTSLDFSDTQFE